MTDDELKEMFREIPERKPKPQTFRLGDVVRIRSGTFASFTGNIEGINQAKSLLKVKIAIFGQDKPIKLNFLDVEKVSGA